MLLVSTAAEAQDARDEFMRGAQLYQTEDYEGALEAFRRSYQLAEVPVVLFNIAQCLRYLDRPAEAITAFHTYLESEEELTGERREAVEAAKGGQVQFKAEKNGVVHAGVGKASFAADSWTPPTSAAASPAS